MDFSPPGSSVYVILQARILEWVAIPFSREIIPIQRLNLRLPHCRQILHHLTLYQDVAGLDLESGFLCFQPRRPSIARTACLGLGAETAEDQTTATVPGLVDEQGTVGGSDLTF